MIWLRWTGQQAKTFMNHGVGEVEPGRRFPVPDDASASFLAHKNVELADPPPPPEPAPEAVAPAAERAQSAKARKPKNPASEADAERPPAEPAV